MKHTRRSLFRPLLGAIAAPAIAKVLPTPLSIAEGGTFIQEPFRYTSSPLDELNVATLEVLRRDALTDNFFVQSPLLFMLNKRQHIIDSGGRVIGRFGKMPGGKWERLSGGLRYPQIPARLPA